MSAASSPPHAATAPSRAGAQNVPSPDALLRWLVAALRDEGDAVFARRAQALAERVAALAPPRVALLAKTTRMQCDAAAGLLSDLSDGRVPADLVRTFDSLACAVDIVASWPDASLPEPSRLLLDYSDCDLSALVRSCVDAFARLASAREVRIDTDIAEGLDVIIDPDKLQQVVLNLVFNAFKVTPAGGTIELTLRRDALLGEAELAVVDSGTGITTGVQDKLFARHRQADRSGPLGSEWLGFDLGASRDYMRLHGGGLRFVPRPGVGGAEFRAHVPLSPPPSIPVYHREPDNDLPRRVARVATNELSIEAGLGEQESPPDHRPDVLVVEDSATIQRVVASALSERCNIAMAFNGTSGLRRALELLPDLIITDLGLPDLDGTRLVRAIRNHSVLDGVPILVVSGRSDPAGAVRLLQDGAEDYLRKPFLVPELQARAYNLIEAKRARELLAELLGARETDLGHLAADVSRKQHRLEHALDQLRIARELADSANRVKSNFLRMMSHELKTPVTALVLQLDLLGYEPQLASGSSAMRRGLQSMSRSVTRLLHMIDTMLEWARVESGRFRISEESFELSELARHVVDEVIAQAQRKELDIEIVLEKTTLPPVVADRRLLELVLINLLERAIVVSPAGTVSLSLGYAGGQHVIRVVDTGPTLTPQERRDLFDALSPGRDLQRTGGYGSGLGLHVVRDLTEAMGAELCLADGGDTPGAVVLSLGRADPSAAEKQPEACVA